MDKTDYDQWFRSKVEEALRSDKPRLTHDAAIAAVQFRLGERRNVHTRRLSTAGANIALHSRGEYPGEYL